MNIYSIAEAAKPYTDYDLIRENTELPEFPNYRAQLLYAYLHKSSLFAEQSELYALVVSLAQMGLDTHELVSETNEQKEKKEVRARQLRVLAGDYFSSRFYQLLAQAGQVELTRQVAAAICEVNRLKMNLYTKMRQWKVTADEYFQYSVNIKTQLYMAFSKMIDGTGPNRWTDMLHSCTSCEIILDELRQVEEHGFRSGWVFWHLLQVGTKEERSMLKKKQQPELFRTLLHKYNVKDLLLQMLDIHVKQLLENIRSLNSDKLAQELYKIGEPFIRALEAPMALERGEPAWK
jgi:heptaprenyl diphosphate synthase